MDTQGGPDGFLSSFGVSVDPELLSLALTHRSWAYENGAAPHNERLEFLGDSILGQAVTVKLYRDYPELTEGELATRRAALVSTVALAEVAHGLGLGAFLRLGKGEELTGGREKDSILADTVEAVIGAVYLSTDPDTAAAFVRALIAPLLADPERFTASLDPKTSLQEAAAARGLPHPPYETSGTGPDHARRFTSKVTLEAAHGLDVVTGLGRGTSKKAAELAAARDAMRQLRGGASR
ncbi:ribonuclease III [Leucobacter coleopterorum]|uniref:Ribonuclease 3 n=1 Tax=Leucobacter coleopterorum TaxID=2714933 RepID=A0ABX6K3K7_9MICO|nr:ribonuclease III [Leucobacter coleopterorum]QIM19739.1 ribonuclease III [Leucobacter coleopterorum]